MGWGRFDDAYPHHPKLLAVGPDGLALDVAAVCYSNRYGTDGWIPEPMLVALYPPIKSPRKVAAKLVEVGRWEVGDGGWWIHDFTEYNPTSTEAAEKRAKRAEAGRKGGLKSKPPASKPEANGEANASGGASDNDKPADEANGNPDPNPIDQSQHHGAARRDAEVADLSVDGMPLAADGALTFAQTLGRWAVENGVAMPDTERRADRYIAVLQAAMNHLDEEHPRRVSVAIGVIADYLADCADGPPDATLRGMVGRLVKDRRGHEVKVLSAVAESVSWGAGLDPSREKDVRDIAKYATTILNGGKPKEAS